jgi:hypothetical protein
VAEPPKDSPANVEFAPRNDDNPFTLNQLWEGMQPHLIGASHQKHNAQVLGGLLKRMGYEKVRQTVNGQKRRGYIRKK